ncbi:S9 family peptidase [Algivirga pacifica]|uniref:Oligopeptidase B n=1 Tax=Algivirga pacifica TaxID=1162670 RepID=A0ABP9D948_9BACT
MQVINPPLATKKTYTLEKHGDVRIDPYYWMRERENQEVIDYLEEENAYTASMMEPSKALEETLFSEMRSRIKEDDESVPYRRNGYWYYTRYEEGKEYPVYCRKKESLTAPEEVLLDANKEAEGYEYFAVGAMVISDDNQLLAFAVDTVGRRIYEIKVKDLKTGQPIGNTLKETVGNCCWAADNKTLLYTTQDKETLRPNKVWKHQLDTEQQEDQLLFEETDEKFTLQIHRTKSRRYIFINSGSTTSSEIHYVEAETPAQELKVFLPREEKHEYQVEHFEDKFYILTNWQATNFRLMEAPIHATEKEDWTEVIAHRGDVLLEGIEVFKDYMVLEERIGGLTHLRIKHWSDGEEHYLDFGEATYSAWISVNYDFDTKILRYGYNSLTTPRSTFDYHMGSRHKELLKQQPVLGGFSSEDYQAERIHATAADGTQIPISLVYKKGFEKHGHAPMYLTAYGSYGYSYDPYFSVVRLSLLDRGFVFAIAHVRGGEEMGRPWYEDGKLLHKQNTFTDFIACTEHLIAEGYSSPDRIVANGGSAGGLLVGAVINMRPELYKAVVADVPFVDVVTTMLDESIPLTVGEYEEWGNPNDPAYYFYMKSYSPYDQVKAQNYPNLLVTSGLHDSQVQYWEPTKWVAKLRELKTDNNLLLLKTNMSAGHGGASGRFETLREIAFEFAFILMILGME